MFVRKTDEMCPNVRTFHDVTLRDCTLPQDASIRLALYDELTLQNIHSAAE